MMTKNDFIANVGSIARRGVATVALCIAVAAVTATWLWADTASAQQKAPQVTRGEKTAGSGTGMPRESERFSTEGDTDDAEAKPTGKQLTGKLNINTATEEEFQMLPGIGPSKAQRIIAFRTKQGKFERVRDLRRVKGIGFKTLKKLEPYLSLTGQTTLKTE